MYDEPAIIIFFLTRGSFVYAEIIGHRLSVAITETLSYLFSTAILVLVYSNCLLVKVLELTQCVPGVKSRDPHVFFPSGNSTLEHITDKLVKREIL